MLGRPSLRKFLSNPCARSGLVVGRRRRQARETKAAVRRAAAAAGKAACSSQRGQDGPPPWRSKLNSHPPGLPFPSPPLRSTTGHRHQPALLSPLPGFKRFSSFTYTSNRCGCSPSGGQTAGSWRSWLVWSSATGRLVFLLRPWTSWGVLELHLPDCFLGWCGGGGSCDWRGSTRTWNFSREGRTEGMEGEAAAAAEAVARIRVVRCPKCDKFLPELPAYSIYVCGGCGATLQGAVLLFPACWHKIWFNPLYLRCPVVHIPNGWLTAGRERFNLQKPIILLWSKIGDKLLLFLCQLVWLDTVFIFVPPVCN